VNKALLLNVICLIANKFGLCVVWWSTVVLRRRIQAAVWFETRKCIFVDETIERNLERDVELMYII
jgi:hypothetical protein